MKAILRNREGFTREYAVQYPYPPVIRMAKAGPLQTYSLDDLSPAESAKFETIEFRYRYKLPNEETVVYEEEALPPASTTVTYDAIAKLTLNKIGPSIIKQINQKSAMTYHNDKKAEMAAIATKKDLYDYWTNEIEKVVSKHKADFKYGADLEAYMVQIGPKNPPHDQETPYEYLTRMLSLAKEQAAMQWKMQNTYYNNDSTNPDWAYQQQQYQNKIYEYKQQQYDQIVSTSSLPPLGGYQFMGGAFAPALQQAAPVPPLAPAVPKKELPEPVEPKKRLMRKP